MIKPHLRYTGCITAGLCAFAAAAVLHAQEDPSVVVEEKKSPWTRSAAAGATITRGNSDTILLTANINALRKWEGAEISLGADGTYGEVEGTKNAQSLHGFGQYNRSFTERWFGYARVDALHDTIADVDYRLTIGPGAGYYFIKREKTRLTGEVGPSFVYEKQGGEENGYLALRIGERFEHSINARARIWQSLELLPQVDDFDNFILNAEVGVEADLTASLSLRSFVQDTYDNQPAPGRQKNDLRLVTQLGYKF